MTEMMHIITASGFEIDLDAAVVDDMELIDAVVELERGNAAAYPVITEKLLGEEKQRLYDHIRQPDGRVPQTLFSEELKEIFERLTKKK